MAIVMTRELPGGGRVTVHDDAYAGISEEEKARRLERVRTAIIQVFDEIETRVAKHMDEGNLSDADWKYLNGLGVKRAPDGTWLFPSKRARYVDGVLTPG